MYLKIVAVLILSCLINVAQLQDTGNNSNECGRVQQELSLRRKRMIGGDNAKRGEVPWHAGIYTKKLTPYRQICGGSLISKDIVLSVAACFWSHEKQQILPVTDYAVTVGKLYRQWDNTIDDSQQSDVKEIHVPPRFYGSVLHYQEDIAVVVVSRPFEYKVHVRPVCLDFGESLDKKQLAPGSLGKIAGWGLTGANGQASQVLKVIKLPYVDFNTCLSDSPTSFREFFTSDKFCAGYNEGGKAICRGDSGGGLAFPELQGDSERYYLRGIASLAPSGEDLCSEYAYAAYTHVAKFENFLKMFWKGY